MEKCGVSPLKKISVPRKCYCLYPVNKHVWVNRGRIKLGEITRLGQRLYTLEIRGGLREFSEKDTSIASEPEFELETELVKETDRGKKRPKVS
ncbi:hypothetical protein NPIL_445531 [Nephila pilipes]|uniref:Uncharacterized protein n=1 Tax=Nephila pilipes TaxID=299642 RepID=A0A8X6Q5A3_NEPPI|nr:hypothetical protein NPIL_445531 [Nephila pilipes]